jgi:response regulator RpfG family c-di-GMP phosphodiesterase
MMTAFPDIDLATRSINEAKIDNFFTKPFEPLMVTEVVSRLLYERRATELRNRAFARTLDMVRKQTEKPG